MIEIYCCSHCGSFAQLLHSGYARFVNSPYFEQFDLPIGRMFLVLECEACHHDIHARLFTIADVKRGETT